MTKAMHLRRTRSAGVAAMTSALVAVAALGFSPSPAGPRYTDLRRIEPIHGDVAAGAAVGADQEDFHCSNLRVEKG